MEFTYPTEARFVCNGCGLCCGDTEQKKRHILLLEAEANQIEAETCIPKTDFCIPTQTKHPYTFEMKKIEDGKCVFLKQKKCSIYTLRPLICRFYPFDLRFDKISKVHVFDFTLECPGINQGKLTGKKEFKKLFRLAQQKLGWTSFQSRWRTSVSSKMIPQ